MNSELIILGKKIAALRAKRGLTQEKLAEMVGYSTNHIAKLELAGTNPSFELLVKLSSALSIEMKDLFDSEEYTAFEHIKNKFQKIINNSDERKIRLLYKIYRSIDT